MPGISIDKLTFTYQIARHVKGAEVLSDISFKVSETEAIGIIGANGVGKSTLLKLMVGLLGDYTGSIQVGGIPVHKNTLVKVREKTGYIFQDSDSQLFMNTVYEDVAFGPRNYGYTANEVEKRTIEALRMVNIEQLKDHHIYRLSGGEKKLASIATILSMKPDYILFDEPSVGLDPKNRRNLIRVLNKLSAVKIIASHDLDLIYDTCSRVILLAEGKIKADGAVNDILHDKNLLELNGLELPLSFSR